MNIRYKFFKWLKEYSEKQMKKNYLKPQGGCDSCCPKCKNWEHQGNIIRTKYSEEYPDLDHRTCTNCKHEWFAIFTPAGFIEVTPK